MTKKFADQRSVPLPHQQQSLVNFLPPKFALFLHLMHTD